MQAQGERQDACLSDKLPSQRVFKGALPMLTASTGCTRQREHVEVKLKLLMNNDI